MKPKNITKVYYFEERGYSTTITLSLDGQIISVYGNLFGTFECGNFYYEINQTSSTIHFNKPTKYYL